MYFLVRIISLIMCYTFPMPTVNHPLYIPWPLLHIHAYVSFLCAVNKEVMYQCMCDHIKLILCYAQYALMF